MLAPFRFRSFRNIWGANLLSNSGSVIQSVAAAWLMTELTRSQVLVALVQASATIPIMLLAVVAGVMADSYDRRKIMLIAQIVMLLASAILASLTLNERVGPASLLFLTFTVGAGTAFHVPAAQASVRMLVDRVNLPQAISLNAIATNIARSAGPALGGAIVLAVGAGFAFAVNSLSYIAMILALFLWRPESAGRPKRNLLNSALEGLRFVVQSSPVRRIMLRSAAFGFGAAGYQALVPLIARYRIHGDEMTLGMLMASFGIGSIAPALWVTGMRRRWGSEVVMRFAALGYVVALASLSIVNQLQIALAATFVAGMGFVMAMTSFNVAIQFRTPDLLMGRTISLYQAFVFGGMALGAGCWGMVSEYRGVDQALQGAAAWMTITLVLFGRFAPMPGPAEGQVRT